MDKLSLVLHQARVRQLEVQKEINMLKLAGQNNDQKLRELLTEARINENLKLVIKISGKFKNYNTDDDELFAIGLVGLVKAAQAFDESRNIKFSTFAGRCIQNEILMYFRKEKNRIMRNVSLETPIAVDKDGNESTVEDVIPGDVNIEKSICEKEFVKRVLELVEVLPIKQKEITKRRLIMEEKQNDIHKAMGISRSYVSKLERSALSSIRYQLRAEELTDK